MFDKVITKEALLYFSQQFYTRISNTFARKNHTHTSLANKEHTHSSSEVFLSDGRDLEGAFTELENKMTPITNVILSSNEGITYELNIDNNGVIYTTKVDNVDNINQHIIINGFTLTIDSDGRLITTKK